MIWRSLRTRLTLAFVVVTVAAFAVVFLYVTSELETGLRQQKLEALSAAAQERVTAVAAAVNEQQNGTQLAAVVREAGDRASARATLLVVSRGTLGLKALAVSDSTGSVDVRDLRFDVAIDAARQRRVQTGRESSNEGPQGQAAAPIVNAVGDVTHVFVLTAPLTDVERSVSLVREKIAIAGGLALALALLAGLGISHALVRRVSVLEQGAERVAAGDFSTQFPTNATDELGQLSYALDDMQQQLAELDTARKRFIATASHELRTPIFSLAGFLELLEDEEMDDETRRDFIGQLRGQVDRLGSLATSLLDLSKLEAGSLELRTEPTDLHDVLGLVVTEFAPVLAQAQSQLQFEPDAAPLTVTCDPERVGQVLRILIDNAVRHNPPGTTVRVDAGRTGNRVAVTVADDGPGIARDVLPRIFEPFVTGDDVRGSGLGLAIARELVERMGGRLSVASKPGATVFSITLRA